MNVIHCMRLYQGCIRLYQGSISLIKSYQDVLNISLIYQADMPRVFKTCSCTCTLRGGAASVNQPPERVEFHGVLQRKLRPSTPKPARDQQFWCQTQRRGTATSTMTCSFGGAWPSFFTLHSCGAAAIPSRLSLGAIKLPLGCMWARARATAAFLGGLDGPNFASFSSASAPSRTQRAFFISHADI